MQGDSSLGDAAFNDFMGDLDPGMQVDEQSAMARAAAAKREVSDEADFTEDQVHQVAALLAGGAVKGTPEYELALLQATSCTELLGKRRRKGWHLLRHHRTVGEHHGLVLGKAAVRGHGRRYCCCLGAQVG